MTIKRRKHCKVNRRRKATRYIRGWNRTRVQPFVTGGSFWSSFRDGFFAPFRAIGSVINKIPVVRDIAPIIPGLGEVQMIGEAGSAIGDLAGARHLTSHGFGRVRRSRIKRRRKRY